MGIEHLRDKRTGRPPGSKSTPPWVRDVRWACANLGNQDAEPPSDLARALVTLGREHPDRLFACRVLVDGPAPVADNPNREASDRTERESAPAAEPHDPQNGTQVPQRKGPLRFRTVSLAEKDVVSQLGRYRANLPCDCKVVGCALDKARGVVVFTITSEGFQPVPEGEPIPELAPTYSS
jgi:hypothetical protein